ncbi:hypothetical protein FOZ62_011315 [Perkinsus olseni]|uniref:Uncharacterized protein n=1 Tax=Perkinsus olseni TaxID=32597 RepID=A0A7J6NAE2_PEROL|nr:hypothetical protein FOZ62_011315 [Perkinsus olseni]
MESEVAEYGPKKLEPADGELPPRPEAVGPKIPGTGDLVIVWQLEGSAEEQLSLGKIDFKPANGEKIVTALPEDVTIGVDREAWMSIANGSDGSITGEVTAGLSSPSGPIGSRVSLALSAEGRRLFLVDPARADVPCRENGPPVRAVVNDMIFMMILLQAEEGISSIIEARLVFVGRLPRVLGLSGIEGDPPRLPLCYGRECGQIRLVVKVGDQDLPLDDESVTCRVTPPLPAGISLKPEGVLSGIPRMAGCSEHSIIAATAEGESEPFCFTIEVDIEEVDMARIRWAAAEGGRGVAVITDRIAEGSDGRAYEIYRHFAYTLPEHQKRQREFWSREKQDVIVVDQGMTDKLQEMIDDTRHSDGDTTTRVLQLMPGTYVLPGGILRLRHSRVTIQGVQREDVTIIGQIRVERPGCVIANITLTNYDSTLSEGFCDEESLPCGIVINTESSGALPTCTIKNCDIRCIRNSCVKFISPPTEEGFETPGGVVLERNRFSVIRDPTLPAVDFRGASGIAIEHSLLVDNLFSPLCYGLECKKGYQPRTRGSSAAAIDTFEAQMMLSASLHPPDRDFNVALREQALHSRPQSKARETPRRELPPRAQPEHTLAELDCCYPVREREGSGCVYVEAASMKANKMRSEQLGFRNTRLSLCTFCGKSDAWRKREALNKEPRDISTNMRQIVSSMCDSKASSVWKFPDNGRIRIE